MKKITSHVIVITVTKGKVANYDGDGKLRNEVKDIQCSSLKEAQQCFDFHIGQQLIDMKVSSILINGKAKGEKFSKEEEEAYKMVSAEVDKIMEPYLKKDVKENRAPMTEEAIKEISKNAISGFLESVGLSIEDIKEAAAVKKAGPLAKDVKTSEDDSKKEGDAKEGDDKKEESAVPGAKKTGAKKPTETS